MSHNNPDKNKTFSATEVGALIESIDSKVSLIAERLVRVEEKVDTIQADVDILKTDMTMVKDIFRVNVFPRLTRLEAKVFPNH